MKNQKVKLIGIGVLFCILGISCTTAPVAPQPAPPLPPAIHQISVPFDAQTNITLPTRNRGNNVNVFVEFEPVGIVFVNATEVVDQLGNRTGSQITYEMFMREAARLQAHEVININVDVNIRRERQIVENRSIIVTTYTYTGTGLAIRFRNAEIELLTNIRNNLPDTMEIPSVMVITEQVTALLPHTGLSVSSINGTVHRNTGRNQYRLVRVGDALTPDTIIRIRGTSSSIVLSDGVGTQTITGNNYGRLEDLLR